MRVILSQAKNLTYQGWITQVQMRAQWSLGEVPRRLRGSG
jgi:hypothetical protein